MLTSNDISHMFVMINIPYQILCKIGAIDPNCDGVHWPEVAGGGGGGVEDWRGYNIPYQVLCKIGTFDPKRKNIVVVGYISKGGGGVSFLTLKIPIPQTL